MQFQFETCSCPCIQKRRVVDLRPYEKHSASDMIGVLPNIMTESSISRGFRGGSGGGFVVAGGTLEMSSISTSLSCDTGRFEPLAWRRGVGGRVLLKDVSME